MATYVTTSQLSHSSRTPPCPLCPLQTPWHNWRRPAAGWRKLPSSPPSRGTKPREQFMTCSQILNVFCEIWSLASMVAVNFTSHLFSGIRCPAFSERRPTKCLSRLGGLPLCLSPVPTLPASAQSAPGSNQKSTKLLASRPPSPVLLSAPLPPLLLSYSLQHPVYLTLLTFPTCHLHS